MAHLMTVENGQALMGFVDEAPWHAGETNPRRVSDAAKRNSELFMVESGLDYEVGKFQLGVLDGGEHMNMYAIKRKMPDGTWKLITDSRAVGDRFTILPNRDAFKWFDPFLQANEATLNTAGALLEGSRIWVLAKLQRDPIVVTPQDIVEKYLLLSHAHDGSLAIRVGFTPIRVVCHNTLSAAHNDKASKLIRVKHSKSLATNLENIRATMNVINQEFEATAQQYKLLVNKQINAADVRKYVKRVFELDELKDEEISTRSLNLIGKVEELFETGKGNTLPTVKGSYWALYNGLTEYLSWEYAKPKNGVDTKVDSRMNSLWFGDNADMNQRGLQIAVEMAMAV